jgi:hypothetical protein
MLGQTEGHPHMTSVFLLPLVALFLLRYFDQSLTARALVSRLGVVLAAQLLLSTEVFFVLTVSLAVSLATATAMVPQVRLRVRAVLWPLAGAYGLAALIASPLLVDALIHFESKTINAPASFSTDLLNPVVPTALTALNSGWAQTTSALFVGSTAEQGAYLGFPLIAILAWFAWSRRRSPPARLLIVLLLLGLLAELGPSLRIRGHQYATLPWSLLVHLPVFNNVLPARLAVFVALAAAVIAALWSATTQVPRWLRIVLPVLAAVAIVPAFWHGTWHVHPTRPMFFSSGAYLRCLSPSTTVLALPYPSWGDSMLWQAEHDFRYRMADGSLSPVIPPGVPDLPTVLQLVSNDPPTGGGRAIVNFARHQHADAILVDGTHSQPWRSLLDAIGLHATDNGGVYLYRLSGHATSCP